MRSAILAIALIVAAVLIFALGRPRAASNAAPQTVAIAAASDLKFVFDELRPAFEKAHPGIQLQPAFGSSGNFFAQLGERAPFDVYLSADVSYPRKLIEQNIGKAGGDFIYATGLIVLWVPKGSALEIEKLGFKALLEPGVKKIALANPRHAPYGRAAEAALKKAGIYPQVEARLVYGDNIAQSAQFVDTGAADAGIIALSLATAPGLRERGRFWQIPRELYPPLEQGGLILPWAKHPQAAAAFKTFLLGTEARAILKRYGFVLPNE